MNRTSGGFETEGDALALLDDIVAATGMFHVYREVEGYYMTHRPGRDLKTPRIDRILVPTPRGKEFGWKATIGVEAKRSGAKLGPLVCQALDYSWAIYRVGDAYLHPEGIFLFPVRKEGVDGESIYHAIESVMTQNRIGYAYPDGEGLTFGLGGCGVLRLDRDVGRISARGDLFARVGRKIGTR